jgi:sRNA-binding carbon storage regulator CsrA
MKFVQIGDAFRERIFRETYRFNLSGEEKFKEKTNQIPKYCKGEFGFIHPKIVELYEGKTEPWIDDDSEFYFFTNAKNTFPKVRDLTKDEIIFPGTYNFDPKNILICMLNHNLKGNALSLELVLRPFYEEEIIRDIKIPDNVSSKVLKIAYNVLDNGIVAPRSIPIEYVPRKIDPSTLRSSKDNRHYSKSE